MTTTHAGPPGPEETALAAATLPEPGIVTCDASAPARPAPATATATSMAG